MTPMRSFVSTPRGPWRRRAANDNSPGAPMPRHLPGGRVRPSAALRLMQALEEAWEKARQRRILAQLTDLDLKDAGWTRADILVEVSKPFWR